MNESLKTKVFPKEANLICSNTVRQSFLDTVTRYGADDQVRIPCFQCDEQIENGSLEWIICRSEEEELSVND